MHKKAPPIPAQNFTFGHRAFDPDTGCLSLHYHADDVDFCEKISFPDSMRRDLSHPALEKAFEAVHIMAGISYYKAFIPQNIKDCALTQKEAQFFETLYQQGLGEFAVRNGLDIFDRIQFPFDDKPSSLPSSLPLKRQSLVLIGGGKDSLVSIEALKAHNEPMILMAVNPAQPILDCIDVSGCPSLVIKREIDPLLFELNATGHVYNGHVPITAIISAIATCCALLYGCDEIVLSNERSANEATLSLNGREINHQYSKSMAFETDFNQFIQTSITSSLTYYSLLCPLSEAHIARLFTKYTEYDDVFTSCNGAYKLHTEKIKGRWCGTCPKCQFVFLMFAVSMDKDRLLSIVGHNILTNPAFIDDYKSLCGLTDQKPWECVGEALESASCLYRLSQDPSWKDESVVVHLCEALKAHYGITVLETAYEELYTPLDNHALPERLKGLFS